MTTPTSNDTFTFFTGDASGNNRPRAATGPEFANGIGNMLIGARAPVCIVYGDSRAAGGNRSIAGSGITVTLDGYTATVNTAAVGNHGLFAGVPFFIDGFMVNGSYETTGALNGAQVCGTVVSATVFTFPCALRGTVTVDPVGTTGQILHDWQINDRNVMQLAMARLGKYVRVINRGCSGQTTQRMVARFNRDVAMAETGTESLVPSIVFIRGPGINDINAGIDEQVVFANILSMVDAAQQMTPRPLVVVSTLMPVSNTNPNYATGNRQARLRLNDRIRNTLGLRNGVLIFDEDALATDSTGAQANFSGWRSGFSTDGLHDNATYDVTVSANLATLMQGQFVAPPALSVTSTQDNVGNGGSSNLQRNTNPLFAGSNAATGTGISGTAANSQTFVRKGAATIACTAGVTRTDGIGFDQKAVITSTAAGDGMIHIQDFINTNAVPGKSYMYKAHIKLGGTVTMNGIASFFAMSDGTNEYDVYAMSRNGVAGDWPNGDYDLQLSTPVFTVLPGFNVTAFGRNEMDFGGAGGGGANNNYLCGRSSIDQVGA